MTTTLARPKAETKTKTIEPSERLYWPFAPFGMPLGRLFEDFWSRFGPTDTERMLVPAVDVSDLDDAYDVTVELPGMKKEEVKIELENGVLAISGEKKEEREEKKRNYYRSERRFGSFYRSIPLAVEVDLEKSEAKFDAGILTIHLPKVEKARPKNIKIR
jgi:HSP20 family protein